VTLKLKTINKKVTKRVANCDTEGVFTKRHFEECAVEDLSFLHDDLPVPDKYKALDEWVKNE